MAVCAAFRDVRKGFLRLEIGGQMGIQDVDSGASPAVTDYVLGARGIDAIYKTVAGNTTTVNPIYDAHGNMVGDVSKVGNGAYALNDRRSFDAWGLVRQGAGTGDPKGRYCANLGHKHDDESGLVYMRARYYEPGSGRFLSEDPRRDGFNWLVYCNSNPVGLVDKSGKDASSNILYGIGFETLGWVFIAIAINLALTGPKGIVAAEFFGDAAMASMLIGSGFNGLQNPAKSVIELGIALATIPLAKALGVELVALSEAKLCGQASSVVAVSAVYGILIIMFLAGTNG